MIVAAVTLLSAVFGASTPGGSHPGGGSNPAPEVEAREDANAVAVQPDLGIVRFRDPSVRRMLWFGGGVSGIYLPTTVTGFSRTVWSVRTPVSWALALTPSLAIGGRHTLVWYDAETSRVRIHDQLVELSGRPSAGRSSLRDRLSISLEVRDLKRTTLSPSGVSLAVGGVRDVVVGAGYGAEHPVGDRWRLGWQAQGRLVWVGQDTQRQLRAAFRASARPAPGHELWFMALGHLVHRDPDQYAKGLPQLTVHGQLVVDYAWMSRKNVGVFVHPRAATSFLSGEAPLYEARNETLTTPYGDVTVGIRGRWR